ncbi:MAG: hypothetical protein FJ304_10325 [Planctomycetes bacterium]|nr:hypothetical protein [Planctomycetota bacterium]
MSKKKTGARPAPCRPAPALMKPFRDLIAVVKYPNSVYLKHGVDPSDEWGMGNVSRRAVRYSCGCLTRKGHPLAHAHDPAEVELCQRIATEAADRLKDFTVDEGARIWPFFAATTTDSAPAKLDEALVRAAFGGTIAPGLNFEVSPLRRRGGHWDQLDGVQFNLDMVPAEIDTPPDIDKYMRTAWDVFAEWFTNVPGLREHSRVGIGYSDADPGPLKPRMVLALTAAGSLLGAVSYETQA